VLPAAADEDTAFWLEELNYSMVMVHSKRNQYRWRYYQRQAERGEIDATAAEADAAPTWAGLVDDDIWQSKYFTDGPQRRELAFWLPPQSH